MIRKWLRMATVEKIMSKFQIARPTSSRLPVNFRARFPNFQYRPRRCYVLSRISLHENEISAQTFLNAASIGKSECTGNILRRRTERSFWRHTVNDE